MSIRLRLTIYWAAILSGILIIATIAAFQLFERQQWSTLDAALSEEANTAADEISHLGPDDAVSTMFELSQERALGEVKRVRLILPSGLLADFGYPDADPPKLSANSQFRGLITTQNKHFRYAVMPFRFHGGPAVLEDGVDASPLIAVIARLRTVLLLTVPFVLLLCVGGGYLLAARAIAPLEKIAAELAAIQPRDLSRRLEAPRIADETGRLVAVINALLDRLERASATERRFASDAAHELRTPLAVLRSGLEVALARHHNADENQAALETAHREVVTLCKVAEELLM
ncbi:MAG TPA: histidine kinase dimerization/phospho-acceptor domain-containing protein, partial [Candidatus Binataceae bacterium]|nr:histidine kinase dimerization/phospho-acceptor domain-containing protein [Candidatus Binataceae bacterium]